MSNCRSARRIGASIVVACLVACSPATDRDRYEVGDTGVVTFHNQLHRTLYLAGCNHFDYEKRVGDAWVSQGPDLACFWEGFAQPVASGEAVSDSIRARNPGTWRLRYVVGAGCSDDAPLSDAACMITGETVSNEFEVVDGGCVVTGCSSQLCASEPAASTCEWLPHYACFRDAECGRFGVGGSCGWKPTPELAACLDTDALSPRDPDGIALAHRDARAASGVYPGARHG